MNSWILTTLRGITQNGQAKKIFTWFVEQVKEAHFTEEQSSVSQGIQTARQEWLWETHWSIVMANKRDLHKGWEGGRQSILQQSEWQAYELEAYELGSRKVRITINWLFQIEIVVYQLAKQRMLEFYYNFLDR